MDYWGGKGYVAPLSQIIGGAWPPPPFPTPMVSDIFQRASLRMQEQVEPRMNFLIYLQKAKTQISL